MILRKALTLYLGSHDKSVITAYDFGLILLRLYCSREFNGEPLSCQKDVPGMQEFSRYRSRLKLSGTLEPISGFAADKVFSVLGKKVSAREVVCAVDPFAYISHLSAMDYHGISDRMPKVLFVSTFPPSLWQEKAREKMAKDFGEFIDTPYTMLELPKLQKMRFEKVKGVSVHKYQSKKVGSFVWAEDKTLRVSSVGRTFLDMLREPAYCGGMGHVLDVYEENAKEFKRLILDEVDRHGTSIEKARAGYILEEYCRVSDPKIDEWAKHVMRGGSRKLDPNEEFVSDFSERWCLSINN